MTLPRSPSRPPLWPWATGTVLPFWARTGFDPARRLFEERLAADGSPERPGFLRIRVVARQTYVFAHAATLGVRDPAGMLEAGAEAMERAWAAPDGGYAELLAETGAILDPTAKLYEQAFVLLAQAWLHRATGAEAPVERAHTLARWLDSHLAHPLGGFGEQWPPLPAGAIRNQNPHMHLLEALLALHAATGDRAWLARADAVVDLALRVFAADGTLAEHFAEDWSAAPAPEGGWREPGHHFEWVWLLDRYEAQGGAVPVDALARRLFRFGLDHGIDRREGQAFAVFDRVDAQGAVVDATKRFWPQSEAVRALAVADRRWQWPEARALAEGLLATLFAHYFDAGDGRIRDGGGADEPIPASSLYHAWGMIVEAAPWLDGAALDGAAIEATP